jgi:hypothetical protein
MVQCCERFRFTVEPREALDVGSHRIGENLDGHLPRQVRIGGPIHLTHTAHTNLRADFVRA